MFYAPKLNQNIAGFIFGPSFVLAPGLFFLLLLTDSSGEPWLCILAYASFISGPLFTASFDLQSEEISFILSSSWAQFNSLQFEKLICQGINLANKM